MSEGTNEALTAGRLRRFRLTSLRSYVTLFLTPFLAVVAIGVLAPASALAATGSISGTVRDSSTFSGIPNVTVNLEEVTQGNVLQTATTDSSGNYTFTGLSDATDYVVEFNPSSANPNFSSQFFNNEPSFAQADQVTVAGGGPTTGVDAQLDPVPGQISGTVTDASTHGPLGGVSVEVQDASGSDLGDATTASDGTYTLSNVPAGNDFVVFNLDHSQDFVSQYYNNKPSLAAADPVAVTGGTTTTAINAALVPASGHITGTVTKASTSAPVSGVEVLVFDSNGQELSQALTGVDGTYTVTQLPTGIYQVRFQAPSSDDLAPQYYNNKTGIGTADSVSVTTGATTPGINAALTAGATISGKVTGSGGAGLQNAHVTIVNCDSSGFFFSSCPEATTAADGTYAIPGLAPGNYYVRIDGPDGQNFLTQYYNSSTTEAGATPVAATAGATTTVNQALPAGGQISGRVTDSSGNPVSGIDVEAQDASGSSFGDAVTAADGTYTIMGLDTASYRLEFFGGSKYVTDYYNNAPTLATATPVSVTRGATTAGINTTLPSAGSGGRISGTVTGSNGLPISGISVTVYDTAGNAVISTQTSSDGSYKSRALLPGTYKVGFAANGVNLAFQYYKAQNSLANANTVSVAAGATTPNINATLVTGASVTGTVTDATSHTTLGGIQVELLDSTGHVLDSASTRPDGTYDMTGIPTGSFHVKFLPNGLTAPGGALYAVQYYNNKPALAGSDKVATTAGSTVGNINAALATEGANAVKAGAPKIFGTSLSGISKRKATLKFTVAAGTNAPKLKSFTVKLPTGLGFIKKGLKKGLRVTGGGKFTDKIRKGSLVVTLKNAASKISVKISSKAMSVTKNLAKTAKKRKLKALKVTVSVADASGKVTTLRHTFKKPH